MPVVRFTCCEHLSKLRTDSLLQDRSSCQFGEFGELFQKHKLVFTHLNWRPRCSSQDDCSAFRTHSFCETDTVLCVRLYVHGSYSAMCERRLLKKWHGDVQPSTDEGSANRSLFTCLSKLVSFWTHLLQLSALGTVQQSPAGPDYERELQLSNLVVSLEQHRRTRQKAASDAVGTSSASQNSPPMATSSSSEKTQLGQMAWAFNSHCAPGPLGHFDFIHFQDLISSWTFCSSIQSF